MVGAEDLVQQEIHTIFQQKIPECSKYKLPFLRNSPLPSIENKEATGPAGNEICSQD